MTILRKCECLLVLSTLALTGCVEPSPAPSAVADHTKYIQGLFDSDVPTVTVPAGTWEVDPLFVRKSHKEIVLADGCHILAKKGGFKDTHDNLVKIDGHVSDVTLRGEGKALIEMRVDDYETEGLYAHSEWRHGISVWDAKGVVISNLVSKGAGGDGLYINGGEDVLAVDVTGIDCNRLGLCIISGRNITLRRCKGLKNVRNAPKCGLDLEPNKPSDVLSNVLIEDCDFSGNASSGLLMHLCQMTDRTEPISVVVRNCRSTGNTFGGYHLNTAGEKGLLRGRILLENCISEENGKDDLAHFNHSKDGVEVTVKGGGIKTINRTEYVKPVDAVPLDLRTLEPVTAEPPLKPAFTGWLRERNFVLLWVPEAGRYTVTFKPLRMSKRTPAAEVMVRDWLGTELDSFKLGEKERVYSFETKGRNYYAFDLNVMDGAFGVECAHPGFGLRADRKVHGFTGKNLTYCFRVPKDADTVRVEVVPEEACAAELVRPDGSVADRMDLTTNGRILKASRGKTAADETWRIRFTEATEDFRFRIGAPCVPVVEPETAREAKPVFAEPGPMKGPEVRVRQTPGGPRLFRDGKMVRPRMCFVRPGSGPVAITPTWTHHDLKHIPHRDMDNACLHLRFAQPLKPGEMQLRNLSFYTVENGRRVDVAGFDGAFADRAAFDRVWGVHPKENPYHFEVKDGVFSQWLKPWDRDPIRPMDYVLPSKRFSLKKGVEYHFVFDVRSDVLPQFMPNLWELSKDGKHYDALPMGDSTPLADTVRKAAAEGVDFVVFVPHFIRRTATGDDYTGLDRVCAEIVAANPKAVLIPRVTIEPDAAWLDAHPDHRMVTEDGEKLRMWSVSSRPGRACALAFLSRLVKHLNDAFPDNFGGLQPVGQSTSEWFYEKSQTKLTGYDAATKEAWRQWLKAKGRANWATAEVPTPAHRRTLAAGTCFLDPETQADCLDFNEFLQDEMSGWLGEMLHSLRTLTGGRKLSYTFYGYVNTFLCNGPSPAMSGHYGLGKLLEGHAADVDIICAPICYMNRGWTGVGVNMGAPESVERYGVMWFDENDSRTYLAKCDAAQSGPALCLQTKQKTLDVLQRDTTREILRNIGCWWMDLPGRGWYNDADFWKVISKTEAMERKVMARTRPFAPEVALIVDEASALRVGAGTVKETGVLVHFRRALSLTGVPFGQYILSDVAKNGLDAKLEIHLATWFADVPPAKKGVSRLFIQVPGAPVPKNLGPNDTVLTIKDIVPSYDPKVLDALRPVGLYDIVRKAGVHMYLDREDVARAVVWASDGFATVHAHEDCEINVNLPDGSRRPLKLRMGQCKVLSY